MRVYELRNRSGLEALTLTDREVPQPGREQVLIKMRAMSLNYRDLLLVNHNLYPNAPLPIVPLSDGVGSVVATGENVTRVKLGDRVAGIFDQNWLSGEPPEQSGLVAGQDVRPGVQRKNTTLSLGGDMDGVLAEYVVLHQDGVVRVPEHLKDEEAATLPCAAVTAWNALMVQSALKPGETVLVQGTGGVSLFALQFARIAGARVIVTGSSDEKLQRAQRVGADEVINYKRTPDWDKEVLRLTEAEGVDYVVDMGGVGTLLRSLNVVRIGGQICLVGVVSHIAPEIPMLTILSKQIRLQGNYVGSRWAFERMNSAITQQKLKPTIDRVFLFEEAHDAFRYMEKGIHVGKICIRL